MSFNDLVSAISPVVPDNTSVALNIESTDGGEYITINTTDGGEQLILGAGPTRPTIMKIKADDGSVSNTTNVGWYLDRADPSATNPVFVPKGNDPDTGIGHAADDQLSLIAGGVEGIRIVEDSSAATIQFGQDNYDPMIQPGSGTSPGNVGYSFKADPDTGMSSGAGGGQFSLVTNGTAAITIEPDGVAVGPSYSINNKEFEVNNGTNSIYFDIDTNDNYMVSNKPLSIYGGGATVNAMQAAKYGVQKFRFAMAQSDATRTSDTNVDQPAYLADSGATIICDLKFGCVGAFTLTDNVNHVKFWNVPDLGTAATITVKIKQHASAAKTVSYSTVNIYSDSGSTTKNGSLLWSGGASHVMSTGVDDIDIVQFTVIPTSTSDRDVYGAVIGQNFS